MDKRKLLMGNEAIALGLQENSCAIATSYPGTPASEILSSLAYFQRNRENSMHIQWAVNEKIAFEIAYAASMTGLRTAVSMKQVGLNVASDPLMSAAYMGSKGGFIVISADDPGPHSSQTEQDSRLMAMMAKIPVLDPDSPRQAKDMVALAYELSEKFEIPVMLRPTTRVCHARQDIQLEDIHDFKRQADFKKNPTRWAATPKFRYHLHKELVKKLSAISSYPATAPVRLNSKANSSRAIVVSGIAASHTKEIIKDLNLWETIPIYQVLQPFPLHKQFVSHLIETYDEILIIEETTGVIEMQIADRHRVKGKLTQTVPEAGELLPEVIQEVVCEFVGIKLQPIVYPSPAARRPTLCAGCPHRASFFAIKKVAPKGIFTSDIGCYTLGLNLGAVDTVLCMGAAISLAEGFYQAYKDERKPPDIVATIGDSTFFHAGVPALIDAVVQKVPIVVVILDNRTTAMTGNQPTPASGIGVNGEPLQVVDIEMLVRGCGVKFCHAADPYEMNKLIPLLKQALAYCKDNGPSVVIARHPCLIDRFQNNKLAQRIPVEVTNSCDGCGYCIEHFGCPALLFDENRKRIYIDDLLCNQCGVCIQVCPKHSIKAKKNNSIESREDL